MERTDRAMLEWARARTRLGVDIPMGEVPFILQVILDELLRRDDEQANRIP